MTRLAAIWEDIAGQFDRQRTWSERPELWRAHAPAVSHWTIGLQLEHVTLVNRVILKDRIESALKNGEAPAPPLLGRVVLLTGYIPRGRGNAPASTVPAGS